MDLWGKPFTAAGAQSVDGRCTYVLLRLAGDIGQIQANQSVDAVRDIIKNDTPHRVSRFMSAARRRWPPTRCPSPTPA